MDIRRKLQLGALTVIANGMLALSVLGPDVALAASCPDVGLCGSPVGGQCTANIAAACQASAPAGCTFVSATCTATPCRFPQPFLFSEICHYQ